VTLFRARWVLPNATTIIRDGVVATNGPRIEWIGRHGDARIAGREVEDLGDAILVPGLVNAHIHLDLAAFAHALDGLTFFPWIRTLVQGLREVATPEMLRDSAEWSVADQLAHGVTTIAHTGPGRESIDALVKLGARGVAYAEAFGPDPAQCSESMRALRVHVEGARRNETALVRVGVSPHAPYSVSDALYRAVAQYAREEALPVAVHIAESGDETALVTRAAGPFADMLRARGIEVTPRAPSPIALLASTGVLETKPLCIHAVRVDDTDVALLAAAGASVAHCPRANAWFGHGSAPVHALRAAGVTIGVGTDSIAGNDRVRVLAEGAAAADETLTAADRLDLVTAHGARSLGLVGGVLAPGHDADLAAFSVADGERCDADPVRYLLSHCSAEPSLMTMVAGVVRARGGRATELEPRLADAVQAHGARVRAWAAHWRGESTVS